MFVYRARAFAAAAVRDDDDDGGKRAVCVCVYLRVAGRSYTPFDFRRLGLRSTALLASPRVAKGAVFQEPAAGPYVKTQIHTATYHNTLQYCTHYRIALSICISMNDYE